MFDVLSVLVQTGCPDKLQIVPVRQCLAGFVQHVAGCEMIISAECIFFFFFSICAIDVEMRIKRNVVVLVHDEEPCRFPTGL